MKSLILYKNTLLIWWASLMLSGAGNALATQPGDVVINEVAWMGTAASTNDEWIELFNTTHEPMDLTGWMLAAADGSPSMVLSGVIPANGFFLLERTDETTVSDVAADQLFSGSLSNSGEALTLKDNLATVIDTANGNGGAWPAGNATTRRTMERVDFNAPDSDANWASNTGSIRNGLDANAAPLSGTPAARNSQATSAGPAAVYINSNGSDLNDGLSAATPFATIQRGLHLLPPGAKAVVLGGTFHEQVTIAKPVTLQAIAGTTLSGDAGAAIAINASSVEVAGFSIVHSAQGVRISAGATGVWLSGNAFVGNGTGVVNQGANPVNAFNNWWGCNGGPNQAGCDGTSGPVSATPWLVATLDVFPNPADVRRGAQLLLGLNHTSLGGSFNTVLMRRAVVEVSDGELFSLNTAAFASPGSSRLQLKMWVIFLALGLCWAVKFRRRGWSVATGTLVLCIMLSGCGLLFNNGGSPLPRTYTGVLNKGALWLELQPGRAGFIHIAARLDAQALSLDLLFAFGVDE